MTGFHKFHATGAMLSIIFFSHFMGSRHTKVSTKTLPTGGIIKLSAATMQVSELPRKNICCRQRIVLAAATQASHLPKKNNLLPAAHCFGSGNASKWAAKGIKNMRPKQTIDDDENTTMWNYLIVNKNTTTTKYFGIAVFFFFDVFFFILFLLLFLRSANVLILNGLIC